MYILHQGQRLYPDRPGNPPLHQINWIGQGGQISQIIHECLNGEDVPGIQITIIDQGMEAWSLSRGSVDRRRKTRLENHHVFRLASITKTFTASLMFLLKEEGLIDFDNPVSDYFPDFPNASQIKIKELLNHSSGLKDLLSFPDILMTSTMNANEVWDPMGIAKTVLKKKFVFTPGTDYKYSNSNYLLLGLIAEEVTGEPLDQLFEKYLFNRCGISGITSNPVQPAPDDLISGYDRAFIPTPGWFEVTRKNTAFSSAAFASGNLVSNSESLAWFYHKLFNGEIIQPTSLADMVKFAVSDHPDSEYQTYFGNGIFQFDLNGEVYYGHEGQFIGFDNVVVHQPETSLTIALLANVSTYEKFALVKQILAVL